MSLIEKQLVKFGFTEVTNFQQLVNLGFPTLFKFEENNQTYIGFTNQYKPEKGILQFIISPTNKKDIELYLQNQKLQILCSMNRKQLNITWKIVKEHQL